MKREPGPESYRSPEGAAERRHLHGYPSDGRCFETEGEWEKNLAGGTRGTVEILVRELRDALRR
jgi:hypothetical protein